MQFARQKAMEKIY